MGRFLLYATQHPKTGVDLWALPLTGDRKPFPVVQTPFDEYGGAILARWAVGGVSVERIQASADLRPTVFESPAARGRCRRRAGASRGGGLDGKELFYVAADGRLMAVPIAVGTDAPELERGRGGAALPNAARQRREHSLRSPVEAAVCSRRRRPLLMNVAVEGATAPPITVVLNWDAALTK